MLPYSEIKFSIFTGRFNFLLFLPNKNPILKFYCTFSISRTKCFDIANAEGNCFVERVISAKLINEMTRKLLHSDRARARKTQRVVC